MRSATWTLPRKVFYRLALVSALVIILFAAFSTSLLSQQARAATTFRNPLNSDYGSDPWITYYNGNYYLTATTWSTSASVGITMIKGATIAELKAATPVTIFSDSTSSRCCNIWAPEFHLINDPNGLRWYLYYVAGVSANTNSQRVHVAESAGTDPTIMTINGNLYLFYSAYEGTVYSSYQNIYGIALNNPWTTTGSAALISRPQYSWEMGTAAVNETPVQLEHNGTIYPVFSATWCGNPNYQLGRATYNGGTVFSQSSWVKYASPIFSTANGQYSTAHNGFFKSPDGTEDWIVYHGVTSSGGACDNTRTTRIQKFTWNADGTPNLGSPLALTTDITVPSGEGGSGLTPTPTASTPPSTSPVTWHKFDETSGTTAADSSGNGRNGTLVNGPTWVAGRVGNAANLDGSNDCVSLPAGIVSGLNDFTIATWVKLDTTGSWRRIFDFGSSTTVNMFLVPTSGSTIRFAITTGGSGAEQRINGTSALGTGAWHHVAVTLSGNMGRLYVDGAQAGQNTAMKLRPSSLGNTTTN